MTYKELRIITTALVDIETLSEEVGRAVTRDEYERLEAERQFHRSLITRLTQNSDMPLPRKDQVIIVILVAVFLAYVGYIMTVFSTPSPAPACMEAKP